MRKKRPRRLRRHPLRRDRPPFPMTLRQRLYEVRKRRRKTEIPSERRRWLGAALDFCRLCPDLENEHCLQAPYGCIREREASLFYKRYRANVRFHRPTRKERLYERRKRLERRRKWFLCGRGFGLCQCFSRFPPVRTYRADIIQRPKRPPTYSPLVIVMRAR